MTFLHPSSPCDLIFNLMDFRQVDLHSHSMAQMNITSSLAPRYFSITLSDDDDEDGDDLDGQMTD